jgi:Flp pilus assembly protein TadD
MKAAELPGASAELEDEIGFLFAVLRRHRQLGDFVAMIRELKAAIAIRPDYAEAHYIVGIGFKQTDDLDTALPELQEAIRLDPSTPGPFNTLGQILRIKGDKQGSAEAFATGARLKREKEGQLANTLEQGMRDGSFPKPLSGPPR